jgi:hypothetical protein
MRFRTGAGPGIVGTCGFWIGVGRVRSGIFIFWTRRVVGLSCTKWVVDFLGSRFLVFCKWFFFFPEGIVKNLLFFGFVGLVAGLTYCFLGVAPEGGGRVVLSDVEVLDAYSAGYRTGYFAFLEQSGEYVPMPSPVAVYSVGGEDYSRGYVDGYHRATAALSCPR